MKTSNSENTNNNRSPWYRSHFQASDGTDDLANWLLPFSDMVIFIMACFVMLYITSSSDIKQQVQVYNSIAQSMGVEEPQSDGFAMVPMEPDQRPLYLLNQPDTVRLRTFDDVYEVLDNIIEHLDLESSAEVSRTESGVQLKLSNALLFASGKTEVNPKARDIIVHIAQLLQFTRFQIRVEGHTDDIPINTALFPSNWELSTARAARVVRLLEDAGLESEQLSVIGYAHTKPLKSIGSSSEENSMARTLNRRVVLEFWKE